MDKQKARKEFAEMFAAMGVNVSIDDAEETLDDSEFCLSFDHSLVYVSRQEIVPFNSLSPRKAMGWYVYVVTNTYSHHSGWDSDIVDVCETFSMGEAALAIVNVCLRHRLEGWAEEKNIQEMEEIERQIALDRMDG